MASHLAEGHELVRGPLPQASMKARWIVTAAAAALATCSTRRPIHPSFRYCPVMAYEDTWTWG
jgi:hypothetical protein